MSYERPFKERPLVQAMKLPGQNTACRPRGSFLPLIQCLCSHCVLDNKQQDTKAAAAAIFPSSFLCCYCSPFLFPCAPCSTGRMMILVKLQCLSKAPQMYLCPIHRNNFFFYIYITIKLGFVQPVFHWQAREPQRTGRPGGTKPRGSGEAVAGTRSWPKAAGEGRTHASAWG